MVTEQMPYGQPAAPAKITIEITLQRGVIDTPGQLAHAVQRAMWTYGRLAAGTTTPFIQQPGFPQGDIRSVDDLVVGTWKVEL